MFFEQVNHKKPDMRKLALLVVFVLLVSHFGKSQDFQYSYQETYTLDSQANLTVSSSDSDIEVMAHESGEIKVFYIVKKRKQLLKSAKEEIENLVSDQWKFTIEHTNKALTLRVVSTVTNGHIDYRDAIDVHFKIYVPKDTNTDLFTSDGDIVVIGLNSNQKCVSSDGDIKLVDLKGKVYAQTSDGDITMKNVSGVMETHTNDGRVIKKGVKQLD